MKELKVSWKIDPDEGYIIFIDGEKIYTATTREEKDNFITGIEKAHREATKIGMRVDGFIGTDNPPGEEIIGHIILKDVNTRLTQSQAFALGVGVGSILTLALIFIT